LIKQIFSILICFSVSVVFSQSRVSDSFDTIFEQYHNQTPGVSVLVVKDQNILYKKNFGLANLECSNLIGPKTLFNAASLAKQFVAYGIYLLKEEGRLSLYDKVYEYLPEFPRYAEIVSIYHLLSHTSGVRDQRGLLTLAGYRADDFISNEAVFQLIVGQEELNFKPGTQFEYSHSNYTLLAKIIERITGTSLNEYLKKKVFIPLEMYHSFFLDNSSAVLAEKAYSYEMQDNAYSKVMLNYQNYGPTNLISTVNDLQKWADNFSQKEEFSPGFMEEFDAISKLKNGDKVLAADLGGAKIFGCKGQFYRKYKGFDFYSHGGSLGGFRSFLGRFPKENLSIIILGNESSFNTYKTALTIADIILGLQNTDQATSLSDNSILDKKEEANDDFSTIQVQYSGNYFNEALNSNIQITSIKNTLNISIGKNKGLDVLMVGPDQFKTKLDNEVTVEFIKNERKEIKSIMVSTIGVREMIFKKID
jgi:CubicO group peptidase (beta-lactamase class C family)